MPRRNVRTLLAVLAIALLCYRQGGIAERRMLAEVGYVVEQIERNYVEPVPPERLFEGALDGMVSGLDPNSQYISPRLYEQFLKGVEQKFAGIGVQIYVPQESGRLTVITPIAESPAFRAGLQADEQILKIDDRSTEGMSVEDASRLLGGSPGTKVRLVVAAADGSRRRQLELERAEIHVDSVLGHRRRGDGGWDYAVDPQHGIYAVRIDQFGEETIAELRVVLDAASQAGMRGLVLDLRNNPGGILQAGTGVCELFLRPGLPIVTTRGRDQTVIEEFVAAGDAPRTDLPLVVLVNRMSASASEIVAACLQDHGRAKIVGERTWGKGTVQDIIPLQAQRSALKLTTASYWRPSGRNIHRRGLSTGAQADEAEVWGVRPDEGCEVHLPDEEFERLLVDRRRNDVIRGDRVQSVSSAGLAAVDLSAAASSSTGADESPVADRQLDRAVAVLREAIGG
jgi:carboxyl-terminal processing protease